MKPQFKVLQRPLRPNTVVCLLLIGILLPLSACQHLEVQRAEVVELRERVDSVYVQLGSLQTALCEYRCEQRYESCSLFVDIYVDVPGREPPRGPGPDIPGCWPYACESDEERELAEENPPLSCLELKEACKAQC